MKLFFFGYSDGEEVQISSCRYSFQCCNGDHLENPYASPSTSSPQGNGQEAVSDHLQPSDHVSRQEVIITVDENKKVSAGSAVCLESMEVDEEKLGEILKKVNMVHIYTVFGLNCTFICRKAY